MPVGYKGSNYFDTAFHAVLTITEELAFSSLGCMPNMFSSREPEMEVTVFFVRSSQ